MMVGEGNASYVTLINGGKTPVILINGMVGKHQLRNPNQWWRNTDHTHQW
jgi:hypothetical protein